MKKERFLKALYIIIPILIVAILGSIFVNIGMPWFEALKKPSQWIPNFVIPVVWTVIYIDFLVVLILWQNNDKIPFSTIVILIINGVLNVLWCLVFFTLRLTFVGNLVIILNLIAGYYLIFNIKSLKPLYSYILLIYPIWLSFATSLNLAMWILN